MIGRLAYRLASVGLARVGSPSSCGTIAFRLLRSRNRPAVMIGRLAYRLASVGLARVGPPSSCGTIAFRLLRSRNRPAVMIGRLAYRLASRTCADRFAVELRHDCVSAAAQPKQTGRNDWSARLPARLLRDPRPGDRFATRPDECRAVRQSVEISCHERARRPPQRPPWPGSRGSQRGTRTGGQHPPAERRPGVARQDRGVGGRVATHRPPSVGRPAG